MKKKKNRLFVAENPESPPHPRRREDPCAVVDHHGSVEALDSQRVRGGGERERAREHVRQWRSLVADAGDIEEPRPGDPRAREELRAAVAADVGHEPAAVEDSDLIVLSRRRGPEEEVGEGAGGDRRWEVTVGVERGGGRQRRRRSHRHDGVGGVVDATLSEKSRLFSRSSRARAMRKRKRGLRASSSTRLRG